MSPFEPGTAYVLKMYPRFSETFIVSEILAREAAGDRIEIFSLRPTNDPRFHPELARVQAPVTYIDRPIKTVALWESLRMADAAGLTAAVGRNFGELAAATADDAVQAINLATALAGPQHPAHARPLRLGRHHRGPAGVPHHRHPVLVHRPRGGYLP